MCESVQRKLGLTNGPIEYRAYNCDSKAKKIDIPNKSLTKCLALFIKNQFDSR